MPPQQQQNTDENAALWLGALGIIAVVVIWFTLHTWISFLFLKLKLAELLLLQPFTHHYDALIHQLRLVTFASATQMPLKTLGLVGTEVGEILRYPIIAILVIAAVVLYFGSTAIHYRNTYTMNRLAEEQEDDWPQITPVVPLDLTNTPIHEGPWAMSVNPMPFAKKHKLLIAEKKVATEYELSNNVKMHVTLKRFEAKQAFLMQLGHYWHSPEKLPPHVRALLAMFAAKAHGDKEAVRKLNNQIAVSAANSNYKKINFEGTDELLKKHFYEKDVQQIIKNHAFVYTVMAQMLEFARRDGVYASADFLWLKPIDRRLWYTLNCVGRKTPFTEVAGIFAHQNAERLYNRPLYVPMVDEAVDALEIALAEVLFKPGEEVHT